MKNRENDVFLLRMTQSEMERRGLAFCKCGHPPNNHFNHGTCPCARCGCLEYVQTGFDQQEVK